MNKPGVKKWKRIVPGTVLLAPGVEFEVGVNNVKTSTYIYFGYIIFIILLTIAGQVIVQSSLDAHSQDSLKINIAGRQRMLGQRLGLQVGALVYAYKQNNQTSISNLKNDIASTLDIVSSSTRALVSGNSSVGLNVETNSTFLNYYVMLAFKYKDVTDLVGSVTKAVNETNNIDNVEIAKCLIKLEQEIQIYVNLMNSIVDQYVLVSNAKIETLELLEMTYLSTILFVWLFQMYCVIMPGFKNVQKQPPSVPLNSLDLLNSQAAVPFEVGMLVHENEREESEKAENQRSVRFKGKDIEGDGSSEKAESQRSVRFKGKDIEGDGSSEKAESQRSVRFKGKVEGNGTEKAEKQSIHKGKEMET